MFTFMYAYWKPLAWLAPNPTPNIYNTIHQGGSLGDLMALAPQGRVSEPVVAHTMQGLCRALAYLHGERKIHRDVKVCL